ncbi:SLATT domain-containing protein [Fulvivirga kasyanovii]|uniref:SLATT domain-containing protein n=1 Tax=Fulvivirga kasyanovii TaxID=396812 RepID=A0ABW9RNM0_9BACT|nr:SLATT domain-containing protein [Fulvivirga kasyanovii]MTI25724.1 SLATT domain-containing protein [Fulvivirga kasyanovii]
MEQNSQVEVFDSQIRELYGRVVWSHKTQEKCADIIWERHKAIKITQIVLSATTTTGILVAVFGENYWVGLISAILSALLFGLNTYTKDYDLGEIAQKHSTAANNLWNIRESYLSLLTDMAAQKLSVEQIRNKRDELQDDLFNIYKGSPRTISKAYQEATKALNVNEELTFSKKELNQLLPESLRK